MFDLSATAAINKIKERREKGSKMDKRIITIVSVSSMTTFVITFGSSILSAVAESKSMPSDLTLLVAFTGALIAVARKVEDYLKNSLDKEQAVEKKEFQLQAQNGTGNGAPVSVEK